MGKSAKNINLIEFLKENLGKIKYLSYIYCRNIGKMIIFLKISTKIFKRINELKEKYNFTMI